MGCKSEVKTSSYFFTLCTEDSCDRLETEGRPAEQTVGLSVPARRLLDAVQTTGQTPADTSRESAGPSAVTSERLTGRWPHWIRSCSTASIMAARARTPLMISFSSSVSSSPRLLPPELIVCPLLLNMKTHVRSLRMFLIRGEQTLRICSCCFCEFTVLMCLCHLCTCTILPETLQHFVIKYLHFYLDIFAM